MCSNILNCPFCFPSLHPASYLSYMYINHLHVHTNDIAFKATVFKKITIFKKTHITLQQAVIDLYN
jgi:hypothetical protein